MPGGFLDPGEILEEALLREVREEVGLELGSWEYIGGWPNQYPYKSFVYSVVDIYFAAHIENFGTVETCQEEVDAIRIANPKTIKPEELAFPSLEKAINRYLLLKY